MITDANHSFPASSEYPSLKLFSLARLASIIIDRSFFINSFAFLKRNDEVLYWSFFNKIYPLLTIEERVNLWLSNLNNHYDYAELLQGAHKLSVDQRKLLNKKIKKHAKEERFVTFLTQIPDAEITEKNDKEIVYKCKWRNLYYKNGEIIVFINKTDALETYVWSPAREEWNWLTNEYFNRKRIGDIYVYTRNRMIMNIIGLEEIEERIIIADIQKKGTLKNKRIIANEQIVRIIHNVAARNKCIDFLSRQDSHFNAVDIQELVSTQYGEIKRDISFMFIIPNNSYAYIIWESVEFEKSKATYIFRCNVDSALLHANNVKDYIENNIHIRSKLSYESGNSDLRNEMKFFAKVNHDSQNYEIWESRMKEILPFME